MALHERRAEPFFYAPEDRSITLDGLRSDDDGWLPRRTLREERGDYSLREAVTD